MKRGDGNGHGQAVFKGEGTVTGYSYTVTCYSVTVTCYSYTVTVTGYSSLNSTTVRLTSIYYRVPENREFCFAPVETIVGQVK